MGKELGHVLDMGLRDRYAKNLWHLLSREGPNKTLSSLLSSLKEEVRQRNDRIYRAIKGGMGE